MSTVGSDAEDRLLELGAIDLGVLLGAEQRGAMLRYLDLMYVWNRAAGLTTIPRGNALRLHLLDSLAAAFSVTEGPCVDLGTGAGLPGVVLAIAKPELRFVLVESNRKRCSFLMEAVRVLSLANVAVVESSVEELPVDFLHPTVISRAFRQPPEFLRIAKRLVQPRGHIVLLLADPSSDNLADLEAGSGMAIQESRRIRLPGGGESRTIVSFRAD